MSSDQDEIIKKVERLERELLELKTRLNQESGQRAAADESLSSRIHMLSANAS